MLIYATILRNFIMYKNYYMYINIPFNYTNPPPPAPSPLLMKDFDIFFAIRKTLFFPQSSSKSLPYESYKIIASEIFAFRSATYLENLVFSPATFRNSIFYFWSTGGRGGLYIKWNVSIELESDPLEKVMTGCSVIFPSTPLTSNFQTFVFFEQ